MQAAPAPRAAAAEAARGAAAATTEVRLVMPIRSCEIPPSERSSQVSPGTRGGEWGAARGRRWYF